MRKLTVLTALALLCTPLLAAAGSGCNASCLENAKAVFKGAATQYTLRIDDAQHAHIQVTWTSRHNWKLKPVTFDGIAPVHLRHTSLNSVEFADKGNDVCHAVVTLLETRGDDVQAYQVPVRNRQCSA
ncbi:hypothetical protein [Paraburkholderia sp. A3RO-2L]|jgi:hypothetical protein|uniref:hypothetical protein n=1 Tax=unclassified Paraburkholderia TaxID=2615204 RepID=UPI003DA92D74